MFRITLPAFSLCLVVWMVIALSSIPHVTEISPPEGLGIVAFVVVATTGSALILQFIMDVWNEKLRQRGYR